MAPPTKTTPSHRHVSETAKGAANWWQREQQLRELVPVAQKGRAYPSDVWARMGDRERIEACTGRSLDECMNILDLPMELAVVSPCVMNGKVGVIRAILTAVTKVGIESQRLQGMQQEILGGLIKQFEEEEAKNSS